jgi:hypothetical protein
MCIACDDEIALLDEDGICPVCRVHLKIEAAAGLKRLAGYLEAWAAFGEWCSGREPAAV